MQEELQKQDLVKKNESEQRMSELQSAFMKKDQELNYALLKIKLLENRI